MTNAEAWCNKSLRPRKPEGSLGRTAQDVHLDSRTAPELRRIIQSGSAIELTLLFLVCGGGGVERIVGCVLHKLCWIKTGVTEHCDSTAKCCLLQIAVLTFLYGDVMQQGRNADCTLGVAGKRSVETREQRKCTTPHRELWHCWICQHASSKNKK